MPGFFLIFLILLMASPAAAGGDTCRYYGSDFAVGARICLQTPAGARWADCRMALNNPSWQPGAEACDEVEIKKSRTSGKALNYIDQYIRDNKKRP